MSEEIYRDSYKTAVDVGQKFDYWVAGIIGAVLAYSAQHYEPRRYDNLIACIEPIALVVLLVAFWFSFERLRLSFLEANGSHEMTGQQMETDKLRQAIRAFPDGAEDTERGLLTGDQMREEIKKLRKEIDVKRKELDALEVRSTRAFKLRQYSFACGLALLLVAKFLAPIPPQPPAKPAASTGN
jgi:hypothetical protein